MNRQQLQAAAAAAFLVFMATGCATTAPDYFEGWRSVRVNESTKLEPFTQSAPFDLREGASLE
jgi:hypothetical protein